MNTYTIVQFEEEYENYYNNRGIEGAVHVFENAEQVNKFVFEVIHGRLVETLGDTQFVLYPLVDLGMSEEMLKAFEKMGLADKEKWDQPYPSLEADFEIAKNAGWMDISMQDLLLFLNDDPNDRITWCIIQGAPIAAKPKPERKARPLCADCKEEIEYGMAGSEMINAKTGESKLVCDACMEDLYEDWKEIYL